MQVNRCIERRSAVLTSPNCLGEQGIQLPDVEGIALGKVGRHKDEAFRKLQVSQLVAALRPLYPQHLAALRRNAPCDDQRAFPPVYLHSETAAGPGHGSNVD